MAAHVSSIYSFQLRTGIVVNGVGGVSAARALPFGPPVKKSIAICATSPSCAALISKPVQRRPGAVRGQVVVPSETPNSAVKDFGVGSPVLGSSLKVQR